jgi:hypothetical protein
MNRSDDLRKNAWNSLADTQAWLDGETEKKAAGNQPSA